MNKDLIELLVCPVSRGELVLSESGDELISEKAQLAFPIQNGVPVLIADEARALTENESETAEV